MVYFDRVTVSLHILYTASQGTEGSQDRLILYDADFLLGTSCCAPARIWPADIDLKNGEQQSRSRADRKRRNRLH